MPPDPRYKRDWYQAAKANTAQEKQDKEARFLTVLGQLHQPQAPDTTKHWYLATSAALGRYTAVNLQDVEEVTRWVDAVRQALGNARVEHLPATIRLLHTGNTASGDASARDNVVAWLNALPGARRTPNLVGALVNALRQGGFSTRRVLSLWDDLGADMGTNTLLQILGQPLDVPAWLDCASKHARSCQGTRFWLHDVQDNVPVIQAIAPCVYSDNSWQTSPLETNAAARLWATTVAARQTWLQMFTMAEWLLLDATINGLQGGVSQALLPKLGEVGENMPARNKDRDNRNNDSASTLADLGAWIVHHREAVCELLIKDYTAEVVAEMYGEELEHREIIAITWFRRRNIDDEGNDMAFKPSAGAHGWVFAKSRHLARRHLYLYFDFEHQAQYPGDDAIKDRNSFFPRGTTKQNLVDLRHRDDFYVGNTDGERTVQGHKVYVRRTQAQNPATAWVASLYPDLGAADKDFFTRDKLERIKQVASKFATPYKCEKPELEWRGRPAGRGRRA